jgi:hypothetical protein
VRLVPDYGRLEEKSADPEGHQNGQTQPDDDHRRRARCLRAAVGSGDEFIMAGGVEQRHRSFGEIAAVTGLPFVVYVGQDGTDEADDGGSRSCAGALVPRQRREVSEERAAEIAGPKARPS